jgi:FKBP-type peptidyl-prolyl cis-trans isomerase
LRTALVVPALLLLASVGLADEGNLVTTASGLKIQTVSAGRTGTRPVAGDRVKVHYTGRLTDGSKFDSSVDRGEPFAFLLGAGEVIRGWDEGVALMDVGSKVVLTIPPDIAYGAAGRPPAIPPSATLVFEIELLEVLRAIPFRAPDPAKQTKTASGLGYEVVAAGEGDAPRADQGVTLRFAVFNRQGKPVVSSVAIGQEIGGFPAKLRLGPFALGFLPEVIGLMKPGATLLCEVPPALAFGSRAVSPDLPGGSVSVWILELVRVNDVPAFAAPAGVEPRDTASGLRYTVVREGAGRTPKATDTVKVHYTGWLPNGTVFDSSHARGETIEFALNRVIRGWTEGLSLMKEGSVYRFEIPSSLAYGATPPPGSGIPPNTPLVFFVELFSVK